MLFSSATFLLVFLPLTVAAYFLMPTRGAKNVLLLLASLVFYAWGEPIYVILMAASITVNWLFGVLMGRADTDSRRKALLAVAVLVNIALLGYYKYEGFIAQNINALVGSPVIPDLELPLPIGISFYTLQAVSYLIDVYRKQVPPQKNILYLGMYIAMFPQLVAGPIVRYSTIQEQILNRKESFPQFCQGLRLFIVGLAKKVLLANTVAILAAKMLASPEWEIGFVGAWCGLIAYTFQIFFDFSGYSDMAIGLGKMFGFDYLRNFNYPYLATSATEFWRRWHISLSSFFRDYIYIPLGGSRVKMSRWILNIAAVWLLTGVWHGAAWNFVLWGVFYGVLLVLEKFFILKFTTKLPAFFQHIYGILCFMLGWLIFWIEDMGVFKGFVKAMLGLCGFTGTSSFWELTCWEYFPVFLVCIVASTPLIPFVRAKLVAWAEGRSITTKQFMETDLPHYKALGTEPLCKFDPDSFQTVGNRRTALNVVAICVDLALLALLALSVISVVSGSFNPFIYFRF